MCSLNQLDKPVYIDALLRMAKRFHKKMENPLLEIKQIYQDLLTIFEQACFGNSISTDHFINDDNEIICPQSFTLREVKFNFVVNVKKHKKGRSCTTSLSHFIVTERGCKCYINLKLGNGQLTTTMLNTGLIAALKAVYKLE